MSRVLFVIEQQLQQQILNLRFVISFLAEKGIASLCVHEGSQSWEDINMKNQIEHSNTDRISLFRALMPRSRKWQNRDELVKCEKHSVLDGMGGGEISGNKLLL